MVTKELEMREEIPTKGIFSELNICLLQQTALPCKKHKHICPISAFKLFACVLSCSHSLVLLVLIIARSVVASSHMCYIIFCCASLLHLHIDSMSLLKLTQPVSFKFPKLRKSLKTSQYQL